MKNLNELSGLSSVKAPEELKKRTLEASRAFRETQEQGHTYNAVHKTRVLRRLTAAVCALGVITGGTLLYKTRNPEQPVSDALTETIMNSFGFAAYAADTGETSLPNGSTIVFDSGDGGCDDLEKGFFSGCLFKVTGDNIKTVSASIDKNCAIYRAKRFELPSGKSALSEEKGETPCIPGMENADNVMVSGREDEDIWWADTCWILGNGFTDEYDPDSSYGFWAPPEGASDPDEDLQQAWHRRTDIFEGATLSVMVTFTDGSSQTKKIGLHTGKLAVEYVNDKIVLTGEVLDDSEAIGKPYVYGVYGELGIKG